MNTIPQATGQANDKNDDPSEKWKADENDNNSTVVGSEKGEEETSAQVDKPPIENALSDITRALTVLTQTVANISVNMVSKSDISNPESAISKQGSQIDENTEKLKGVLTKDEGKKN